MTKPDQPPVPVSPPNEDRASQPPLAETIRPALTTSSRPEMDFASFDDPSESTRPGIYRGDGSFSEPPGVPHVALGETLQLVRYARRADTLLINGITPHGRRLTFEQREDRQGWYVVAAGRRRRPSQRELGLIVATITQEMEAAVVPERQAEVRSAYRLAIASDLPGLPVAGLEAYRDVLLDEAAAFTGGQTDRLAVVAVEYQAFKRFAIRHGHRIGSAFVQALAERLDALFAGKRKVHLFHKTGKAFRMIVVDYTGDEIQEMVDQLLTDETREWLVQRVWGDSRRTHPEEVNFHIGLAMAYPSERESEYTSLAQRLSDDAYRASKIAQLRGHTSLVLAKSEYQSSFYRWNIESENDLQELAAAMDDGPRAVMAEMSDYLHELVQADLEGMAVAGDLYALVHCAISRDGFWQGTTAMRIAGDRLLRRFIDDLTPGEGELTCVGGFDLGDEFYGISLEGDRLIFARGDINSAGATRVRAGLERVQQAVGWRREDGRGIVGLFLTALQQDDGETPILERVRGAATAAFVENAADPKLHVNDAVDAADYLATGDGEQLDGDAIAEGAMLTLQLPGDAPRAVEVVSVRSGFLLRLAIDGVEHAAAVSDSISGPQVKLRIRNTVASAAICMLEIGRAELIGLLAEVREDNMLDDGHSIDVVGFLRHITDILLESQVKVPAKIRMALGAEYDAKAFVRSFTLEEVREHHPGLFYEAVHHDLLADAVLPRIDRQLLDLIGQTMLSELRPKTRSAKPGGVVAEDRRSPGSAAKPAP